MAKDFYWITTSNGQKIGPFVSREAALTEAKALKAAGAANPKVATGPLAGGGADDDDDFLDDSLKQKRRASDLDDGDLDDGDLDDGDLDDEEWFNDDGDLDDGDLDDGDLDDDGGKPGNDDAAPLSEHPLFKKIGRK